MAGLFGQLAQGIQSGQFQQGAVGGQQQGALQPNPRLSQAFGPMGAAMGQIQGGQMQQPPQGGFGGPLGQILGGQRMQGGPAQQMPPNAYQPQGPMGGTMSRFGGMGQGVMQGQMGGQRPPPWAQAGQGAMMGGLFGGAQPQQGQMNPQMMRGIMGAFR